MEAVLFLLFAALAGAGLAAGVVFARRSSRPGPAAPLDCGDCVHMLPRAKIYGGDTIEDARDGVIHYLCRRRWIEVTPSSPWCDLGRSKTAVTVNGKRVPLVSSSSRATDRPR